MSDSRGLLDRITAFRQRLESVPYLIPDLIPVDPGADRGILNESEAFRLRLQQIVAAPPVPEGPPAPQFTDRARRLLAAAKSLLDRQRAFTTDPLYAALASDTRATDPLVAYHAETVAVTDSAVRLAQSFPDSPSLQLKQCTGLDGLLGVVQERLAVQERALARRRADAERIDKLAAVYTAMATGGAVGLPAVAALAEELLEEARKSEPLRFVYAPVESVASHRGSQTFPAPVRFLAAHAVNVAQVIARIAPADAEFAARPLLGVVAALLVDCGMTTVPAAVLAKTGGLSAGERRLVDAHSQMGAELILKCFPEIAPMAAAVAAHHERFDGTGYPSALKGTTAPSLGRLLAVADVYASLSSPRPHRPARDGRAALTETLLMAEHGQLDRTYAGFLIRLSFYPVGTVVELTDGRTGVVAANHPNPADPRTPGRPVIAVLADASGVLLPHPEHVDLATADRGGILRALPADRRREVLGARYPDLC
ncbi:HD-GYP domain-containing protein [Gemmata sp.]|uniref:HD-GYP domain-containing protein n=1 Tax=Gemmata sp. TaxID=1914242 RepID=UPI003F6FDD05